MYNSHYFSSAFTIINPEEKISLSGYNNRPEPFSKIGMDLEANLFSIKNNNGRLDILSLDTLFFNENIFEYNNLADTSNIFAGASHTHFAPSIDDTKKNLGTTNKAYFEKTQSQIFDLLKNEPDQTLHKIEYFSLNPKLTINRRRKTILYHLNPFRWKSYIELKPDYFGRTNNTIHILLFKNDKNQVISIIWSLACHPTIWPAKNEVSSDFIGTIRLKLREKYGQIPILFFQGLSGNIWANIVPFQWNIKNIKQELLKQPNEFIPYTEDQYHNWSNNLANEIINTLISEKPLKVKPHLYLKKIKIPLTQIIDKPIYGINDLTICEFNLSDNIKIIGFSAEPVVQYYDIIKRIYKDNLIIPVGCIGTTFGYLPTNKMIKEGGYESDGFFKIFGYNSSFKKNIEKIIIKALKKLKDNNNF